MAIVTEYDWESDTFTHHTQEHAARTAWRAAVQEIAERAKQTLPDCMGRVDAAVKIVLAGDVELLPDGTARIASQSNGTTHYHVVNGHCDCRDYEKAPHNFCKHRLSAAIARRAQDLVKAKREGATTGQAEAPHPPAPAQPEAPPAPLPEAPASVNVHLTVSGRQVQLTLRDSDESRLLARLDAVLQRFPVDATPADTTRTDCPRLL